MSNGRYVPPEWYLMCQALGDGEGYPKSDQDQKKIGYTSAEMHKLHDELLKHHDKILTDLEKLMILNCLEGALHYVDIDIPALYDGLSEKELKDFKESLEKRWNMHSTYHQK